MKIVLLVEFLYCLGCISSPVILIPEQSIKQIRLLMEEELNVIRERIQPNEADFRLKKRRLSSSLLCIANTKCDDVERKKRHLPVEEKPLVGQGITDLVVGDKQRVKPVRDVMRKMAKAACQCLCFIPKTVSSFVKTCYGKFRSICCKNKKYEQHNPMKRNVSNTEEELDFGIY